MTQGRLTVQRKPIRFASDARRVVARPFMTDDRERVRATVERVLALSEDEVAAFLDQVYREFDSRHFNLQAEFSENFGRAARHFDGSLPLSPPRRQLIGAYFTHEYSFEAAALFNPSIVPAPNQDGLPEGSVRFLMSLRATGEGHVSSIVFRTGTIDAAGDIAVDPPSPHAETLDPVENFPFDRQTFFHKLIEMGGYTETAGLVLDRLPEQFTYRDLDWVLDDFHLGTSIPVDLEETSQSLRYLARSNYVLELPPHLPPSAIVIFPYSENERRGMEDMRLVRFTDDDGKVYYYGLYMAYNGFRVLPQLLETIDYHYLRVTPLHGKYVQNKGQALFPRKVNGWYMMVSRIDGQNLYLMRSKNIRFWNEAEQLQVPTYPWEFVQIGNCGSPIETPEGWLLLTHGVGPMRKYCIGASLLDLEDPYRVIGQTREPILAPQEDERDGYVPNVVYSCGGMIHNGLLILPYAMSDSATSFATIPLHELLDLLR